MLKTSLPALLLCLAVTSQAQYLETFSTPDKGYLLNNIDDFSGVNWNLTAWAAPINRDDADYFQTTDVGVLECIDLDQEVCWESPLLNTTLAPGMISLSVDLSWVGFDTDFSGDPCTEASLDYIKVQYSVNGGIYQTVPNQVGGATCATIGYAANTPGSPFSGSMTVTQGSIPGGSNVRIRVCVNVNANAEVVTIDNVTVPEMGVTLGCAAPELNLAVTPITCGGPNSGAIDLTVLGGTPGYTYLWSSGSFQQDLLNIPEGTYTVTVTDAASCTATASATVGNSPFSISIDIGPATCEGVFNGSIDLVISGGLQPYTVNWGDLPGNNDPEDRLYLEAGTYVVTVSDASGCTDEADVIVGLAPAGPYSETFDVAGKGLLPGSTCPDSLAMNCTNANFAGVNWTIYALDTLTGIDPDDHFHTAGGVLIARDLDQVVCWESPLINTGSAPPGTVEFSLDLKWEDFDSEPPGPNPPDLVADHIDVEFSCDGGPWERIPNLAGGGVTGHTVVYANGAGTGINGETTILRSNLTCSNLRIRVCGLLNTNAEIFSIDNVKVTGSTGLFCPLPDLSATATDASCFGAADGAIDLSLSGGEAPFTFVWSTGAMTEDISGLTAGTYTVTVSNNSGLRYLEVQVGEPTAVIGQLGPYDPVLCAGQKTTLTAVVAGGTAPYQFLVDGMAGPVSVGPGTYLIQYLDANGCMDSETIVIEQADPSGAAIMGVDTACQNVPAAFSLPGGPFSNYQWVASNFGVIESGQGTNAVMVSWPGIGAVTLNVYFDNAEGCPDSASYGLLVDLCVGTTAPVLPGVRVSPNPFADYLLVQFERAVAPGTYLRLYDAQGRLAFEQTELSATTRISSADLPAGMYMLYVVEDGRFGVWRVVRW